LTKTVVTGGAGFVGSHVAEHFIKNSHEVIVVDNFSRLEMLAYGVKDRSQNWGYLREECPKIDLRKIDIRNFAALSEATSGANIIIHAAGQVAVTTSLVDPRTDFEINALGTFNVLEAARRNDSILVFCSTNKVYGTNVNTILTREETKRYAFDDVAYDSGIPEHFSVDHTGHSPYGCSKLAADIYVQDYAHTYGLKTGVFRMSCIYGERQFGGEDQGWLAWFVIASLTGRPITIYGDGKQVRDVLYVKDLAEAFDRFVGSNIKRAVFNMGGGPRNTLSLVELIDLIEKRTGRRPETKYDDWRPADQKVYISDIRKASESLGWRPTTSPSNGVARVITWVEDNRDLFMK
jgi:CDP-paratose 2-epimerase